MSNSTFDMTITQRVEDNRGRNFLIGLGVLFLIWQVWKAGSLLRAIGFATGVQLAGQPYESYDGVTLTGFLLPIIFQTIAVVGAIAVAIGSGVWYVVWDVSGGIFESIRAWGQRNKAVAQATEAAKSAVIAEATGQAVRGSVATPVALAIEEPPRTDDGRPIGLHELAAAMQTIYEELQGLKSTVEDQLASTETVAAESPAVAPAKPKPRKVTRQTSRRLERAQESTGGAR